MNNDGEFRTEYGILWPNDVAEWGIERYSRCDTYEVAVNVVRSYPEWNGQIVWRTVRVSPWYIKL